MRSQRESDAGLQFKANVQSYTRIRLDKQSRTRTQSISGIINSVCWNSAVTWARGYSPRFTHLRDDKLEGGCKNVPTPLCSFRFVTAVPCPPQHESRASGVTVCRIFLFFFFFFAKRLPKNVEMLRDGDDDVRQAVKQDAFGSR